MHNWHKKSGICSGVALCTRWVVNRVSDRLSSLLSAEEKAQEEVEQAGKEARRLKTGIPATISAIEEDYCSELVRYEETGMQKVREEIAVLTAKLNATLEKGKSSLESRSGILAPRALELIRSAIEGEKG